MDLPPGFLLRRRVRLAHRAVHVAQFDGVLGPRRDGQRARVEIGGVFEVAARGGHLRQTGDAVDVVRQEVQRRLVLEFGLFQVAAVEVEVAELHARPVGALGARVEESYEGLVGVSERSVGRAWAAARTRYRIEWPEASVTSEAHLHFRSSSSEYHVLVEVVASEDGPDGIGHVERRFQRTIPRRLQ